MKQELLPSHFADEETGIGRLNNMPSLTQLQSVPISFLELL